MCVWIFVVIHYWICLADSYGSRRVLLWFIPSSIMWSWGHHCVPWLHGSGVRMKAVWNEMKACSEHKIRYIYSLRQKVRKEKEKYPWNNTASLTGEGWLWKWKKNLQSVTSTGKHVLLRVRFENFSTADADELPSNVRIEKWHHVQLQFYQMSDSPQREPNDDYFCGFQRSKITQVHPLHAEFSLIQTKSYNQYQRRWLGIVSFPSH